MLINQSNTFHTSTRISNTLFHYLQSFFIMFTNIMIDESLIPCTYDNECQDKSNVTEKETM